MAGLGVLFLALASGCGSGCGSPPVVDPDTRLMPDAEKSTVVVSKALGVRANGQESVSITVTVLQADGKPLAGRTVTVAVSGEGNTVTQSAGTTDPQGVALATVKSTLAGVKTVTASVEAEGGPVVLTARPTVQFVILPAVKLAITASPQEGMAGRPLGVFEVTVQDAEGGTVTDSTVQVTMAVADGPAQATLMGNRTVQAVGGVARFSELMLHKAGQGFTLVATAEGLTGALSSPFAISPAAANSLELRLPALTTAGSPVSPELTVFDLYKNVAAGYTGTVRFTSDDPRAELPADYTFTAGDQGRHTFAGLTLKQAGTRRVTLQDVATPSLSASAELGVVAGSPARLLFSQQPAQGFVRAPFSVAVSVLDAWDNRVQESAQAITLSVSQAGVTLEGNRTAVPVEGVALFQGLSIPEDGTGYTLRAAGATLAPVTSSSFNIVDNVAPGTPVLLQGTTSLTRLNLMWTAVGDDGQLGTATSYDLRISSAPITAANFNAATQVATGSPKVAGSPESVRISALSPKHTYYVALKVTDNAGNSSLAAQVVSTQDPDAARLVFLQQPRNGKAGTALQPIQVALQDASGALLDDATSAVTLAVQGAPEFGPFTVAAVDGVATFQDVRIDKVGTGYTLKATSGALAPVTSTAFSVAHAEAAVFALTVPSSPVTAGTAFDVGLRVSDDFGNPVTDYAGTVRFTSGDAQAELPADYTFAPSDQGLKTFSLTLKTADAQTVTVVDTVNTALTATKTVTVRNTGASLLVLTGLPSMVGAGSPVDTFRVEARDAHGNLALDYTGTVHVTSSDALAVLPSDLTFSSSDQGRKSFSATLKTAGSQTVTVRDTVVGTLTASASTTVQVGAVKSLVLAAPASATAGSPVAVTVTARDDFGNTVVNYGGTVHFAADDAQAELPADYTFAAADQGSRQFSVTLKTAKAVQVSVSDGANGLSVSTSVQVAPAVATQLKVAEPGSPVAAGTAFPVEVVLEDAYGNVATGYTGTVFFSSGDAQAVLPGNYTFQAADAGRHTFNVTLKTAGSQTVTVADTVNGMLAATKTVTVRNSGASLLVLTGLPSTVEAGATVSTLQVEARDSYGNRALDYTGTVHFTSGDAQAVLPADTAFTLGDQGRKNFSATLKTAGSQTVTVRDTVVGTLTASASTTVQVGAVKSLVLTAPASATAGSPVAVTVTARDDYGNTVVGYTGTVHFSSGDAQAELPADYTFAPSDQGLKTFSLTLKTADAQTVTVVDTVNTALTATKTVAVRNSGASLLVLTGLPSTVEAGATVSTLQVEARDSYGNRALDYTGTVHFSSGDAQAVLPADTAFTLGDQGRKSFSATLKTAGSQTVTVRDTVVGTLTASASTTVQVGAVKSLVLTAPASATAGSPVAVTVTARDDYGNTVVGYTGTVHFSSGDAQAELPTDYTFAPSDQGLKTFSLTLKTAKAVQVSVSDGASALSVNATVQVAPAAATQLKATEPGSPVAAGTAFPMEVVLEDAYGNVATGYTGAVHFSSGDGQAVLPGNYTFQATDAGRHTFNVTLKTAGIQTVTVADTVNGMLAATKTVTVRNSGASLLVLTGLPSTVEAGATVSTLQVEARDSYGNRALDYTGTVHFTSGDAQAVLPADTAFTLGDQGRKSFSVTLKTAGSQTVTVRDTVVGTLTASASTTVQAGAVKSLVLAASASATAGTPFTMTVRARDDYGNTAVGYTGTVHFAADDAQAELPADYTFAAADQGSRQFSVTLKTAKAVQVSVSDGANGLSVSTSVQVAPAAATLLTMTVPEGPFTAGTPFTVMLKLEDAYGNVATGYTGTVSFTSNDAQAELPGNYTFVPADAGRKSFAVKLKTAGNQTLTVKDLVKDSLSASASRQVTASSAEKLVFSVGPAPGTVRKALAPVTVAIADAYGNPVTGQETDITLSLTGGSLPTVLGGMLMASTTSGAVSFTDLFLDQQGTDFRLHAQPSALLLQPATSAMFTVVDDLAPSAPDLTVGNKTSVQVDLSWTAVGDDGVLGAAASSYELRYATNPDFTGSTLVSTALPEPSGTLETVTLTGLTPNTLYYFALTVRDDANNPSPRVVVSAMTNEDPCVNVTCAPTTVVCSDDGVSLVTTTYSCVDVDTVPMCLESPMSVRCPGTGGVCFEGACNTASPPAVNALTLTELMHSPTSSTTEYMELLNRTDSLLDITGLQVTYTPEFGSAQSFTVSKGPNTALVVGPRARVVLAQNRDTATNGGVSAQYAYGNAFSLDGAGQLQLALGNTVVEEFGYTSAFPQTMGRAMSLSSTVTGTKANAWPWYWCDASTQLPGGDYGSPNLANGNCGVSASVPVDYCAIQYPKTFPSGDGNYPATILSGSSWTIYSQFYALDLTHRNIQGNDYYPHVQAQLGYGTDTTNPAGWTWSAASFNSGFSPMFPTNDDEMLAFLTIPNPGTYSYGFRYRLRDPASGNFSDWTYCDRDNVTVPPAGNYGSVTVTAPPPPVLTNHVVISEVAGVGSAGNTDEFIELYNPTNSPVDLNGWKVQYKSDNGANYSGSVTITPAAAANGNTVIPAKGFFLLAAGGYSGTVTPNITYTFDISGSATRGGHVRIGPNLNLAQIDDPNTVDKLGYGTANKPEGSPAPPHPAAGGSLERKAFSTSTSATMAGGVDALKGNSQDSDNNANDFVPRTARDPQNASSATETP
jgi:hypothetical protein